MPLHSLFSMAARVILLNGKWKHDQNAPMAPHFSWIQRQNLGMVCCPPTPPPSPTVLPALLPFSHTPTRLLSPFMLAINSPWEQFSQGPTRLAPWLHSGLYSNLSLRDFCISPCVKECVHTHTHTHTPYPFMCYYIYRPLTSYIYMLIISYSLSSPSSTKAELCLVYCWTHAAWYTLSTQTFVRWVGWGMNESLSNAGRYLLLLLPATLQNISTTISKKVVTE